MKKLIDILILLGTLSFLVAIFQKVFYIEPILGFIPTSFVKFSIVSLLLAIALSVKK